MTEPDNTAIHTLLTLIQLEARLRWASLAEARFIAVNELHQLIPAHQSFLLEGSAADIVSNYDLTAASGVVQPEPDSQIVQYLQTLLQDVGKLPDATLVKQSETEKSKVRKKDTAETLDTTPPMPPYAALVPVRPKLSEQHQTTQNDPSCGLLVLLRHQPFTTGEVNLLDKCADALAANIHHNRKPGLLHKFKQTLADRRKVKIVALAALVLLMLPVRTSVLAPAEVVPKDPVLVRAPINGIIAAIPVRPNQMVRKDQLLVQFDQNELSAQLSVAQSSVTSTASELRQISQQSFSDPQARLRLANAQGEHEKAKSELAKAQNLLDRTVIKAQNDGVVIFDNVYDWLGQQVDIGQKIMLLANPGMTQLEIRLPVTDAIPLQEKAAVRFFSNAAPYAPLTAEMTFQSYRANKDELGVVSYRIDADWKEKNSNLKLGSKGTAKLYGPYRPFIWAVLRKPLSIARQWLGV